MFTFEHTYQPSEAEYVTLWSPLNQHSATAKVWGATTVARVKRFSIVAAGLIMLLWPYTVGLGVVVLTIAFLVIFAPHLVHYTSVRTFRQLPYLTEPLAYGANTDRVWVRGSDFTVEASWRYLAVWREQGGWLILQGNDFPPIYLPIALLKDKGLYDQVRALSGFSSLITGATRSQGSLAWAAAGVLGVFQFTIEPVRPDVDDRLWVIVGDLPPAYLVLDNAPSWKEALEGYTEEMQRWVDAVRAGHNLDGIIPVNVAPIPEHADSLDLRLRFIREKIIQGEYSDVESDH